jgi:Uma2 family endonuclease
MADAIALETTPWTAVDLVARFGPILLSRVVFDPPPGSAAEEDVVRLNERHDRLCELSDATLVEKTVGAYESYLAVLISSALTQFAQRHDLGIVLGPDGMVRLAPQLVRIPDVSFICWDRLPGRRVPRTAMFDLAPDLAVEVLSSGNTRQEMDRKLRDYFDAGVRLVWYVQPADQTATVYDRPDRATLLRGGDLLDGRDVLPGFSLPLAELFAK